MTEIFKGTKWENPATTIANPTSWDQGADGPANRDGLRKEAVTDFNPATGKDDPNPNGIKRHRRETWVDKYARKGKLNSSQQAAAQNLYAAWAGFPSKDPLGAMLAKVDSQGDDPLAAKIDRRRAFYLMWKKIPEGSKPFIRHVVLDDLSLRAMNGCRNGKAEARYMERLCVGLDAIS